MKKIFSATVLFLLLLMSVPVSSAFAYPGGYANGKVATISDSAFGTGTQTNLLTDSNEITGISINAATSNKYITIDLGTTYTLTDLQLHASTSFNGLVLNYYKTDKTFIGGSSLNILYGVGGSYNGSITSLTANISNVRYISLYIPQGQSGTINEFDVNGTTILPPSTTNLTAVASDSLINLSWSSISNASNYNIKRSTTPGGPYTTIATGVVAAVYTDTIVKNGTTYYYVVTAVNAGGESGNSNEATATPMAPALNRALLVITLVNGLEKEYDLSMTEVNSFINWYNGRAEETGSEVYTFNKTFNLANFLSRKDYIAFSKIETFEVNEYKVNTP